MKHSQAIIRRSNLCRAIELAYSSLQSHFSYSIEPPRKHKDVLGDDHFAANAIKEYAEIILICASELEEITKHKGRKQ
jgi:hypothetical protein